jgi:phosphatidylglycerol:prolipoprotein diacylglycerol transferase
MEFWKHIPAHIDPSFITIGSFEIRYYGLMYLVAFFVTYRLILYRIKDEGFAYTKETIQDTFVWLIAGLLIGARLGYILIYNFAYYRSHPLMIVFPFDVTDGFRYVGISGMSYHGGAIGVVIAALLFCRRRGIAFWKFADLFAAALPLGYTFGRIGNFLNGELYGRATTVPWGMYFPTDATYRLRHPSQLYEALFEGILLFIVLWSIRKRGSFDGFLLSLYLIGYGGVRFVIEFFRDPDPQLGFILGGITMGQLLCLAMIVLGLGIYRIRKRSSP